MVEKTLNVEGMSCAHCKAAVEGELRALSGIEKASADVAMGTVEFATTRAKWEPRISRVPSKKPATV